MSLCRWSTELSDSFKARLCTPNGVVHGLTSGDVIRHLCPHLINVLLRVVFLGPWTPHSKQGRRAVKLTCHFCSG